MMSYLKACRSRSETYTVAINGSRHKTELCHAYIAWRQNGQKGRFHCPYGVKCLFAHGPHELHHYRNAHEMQADGNCNDPDIYCCLPCFDQVSTGDW